jgi:hypothetical protein
MTITRHEGGDITTDSIDIKKIAIWDGQFLDRQKLPKITQEKKII